MENVRDRGGPALRRSTDFTDFLDRVNVGDREAKGACRRMKRRRDFVGEKEICSRGTVTVQVWEDKVKDHRSDLPCQ
jgi:hypothetical protein